MGSVQFKAQREQTLRRKVGGEKRGRLRRTRMFDLA